MLISFDELLPKYNLKPNGILHLGGSKGQEAQMYDKINVPYVIWVEAIPEVFNELEENIRPYSTQIAINACVSNVDDYEVQFNISNNEAQSSSFLPLAHHKIIHPEVYYIRTIMLKTKRVDTLLKQYDLQLGNGWLLNADLQGSELLAIKGLGDYIECFDSMYLEVNKRNTYDGCALIDEVDEYLCVHGFQRVETGQWVGDTWTDALYIKSTIHVD